MKVLFDDKVLIDPIVAENKTAGGIILDTETIGDYLEATILKVGDKVTKVQEGDIILYRKDAPIDMGKKYGIMLSEFNIIAKL